jgi:hypothetical protein
MGDEIIQEIGEQNLRCNVMYLLQVSKRRAGLALCLMSQEALLVQGVENMPSSERTVFRGPL